MPDPLVTRVGPVTEPPPLATVNVTLTPASGKPAGVVTRTAGAGTTTVETRPARAAGSSCALIRPDSVPVAVKVTGLPAMPGDAATSRFTPGPSTQDPSVATPSASVTGVAPVTCPPPSVSVKVTGTSGTGTPPTPVTITDGGVATAAPTGALWLVPPLARKRVGASSRAVAENDTGLPSSPGALAETVLG